MLKPQPDNPNRARRWLISGAIGSFSIALLHLVIIFIGAPGYLYFGAPSLARQAELGSLAPAFLTAAITLLFVLCGVYALSGAGVLSPFFLLRTVLIGITVVYVLRGLVLVPDLIRTLQGAGYPLRQTAFSAVSLAIGFAHAFGLLARRGPMSGACRRPAAEIASGRR